MEAVALAAKIGPLAVELAHCPDLDIRWNGLHVFMTTHTARDVVTELDLAMAARLDAIAAGPARGRDHADVLALIPQVADAGLPVADVRRAEDGARGPVGRRSDCCVVELAGPGAA